MLAASAMEGSRTTLDETAMPPPSTPRGVKRKTMDKEATLPVRTSLINYLEPSEAVLEASHIEFLLNTGDRNVTGSVPLTRPC